MPPRPIANRSSCPCPNIYLTTDRHASAKFLRDSSSGGVVGRRGLHSTAARASPGMVVPPTNPTRAALLCATRGVKGKPSPDSCRAPALSSFETCESAYTSCLGPSRGPSVHTRLRGASMRLLCSVLLVGSCAAFSVEQGGAAPTIATSEPAPCKSKCGGKNEGGFPCLLPCIYPTGHAGQHRDAKGHTWW